MLDNIKGGMKMKNLFKLFTRLSFNYSLLYNKELTKFNVIYNTKSNFDIFLHNI